MEAVKQTENIINCGNCSYHKEQTNIHGVSRI